MQCIRLISILVLTLSLFSPLCVYAQNLLIVGDSLSAGYGIPQGESWVDLLRLKLQPLGYAVVNVSTSGDTTRNGLAKLGPALKKYKPTIVILELGANDGLRGLSLTQLRQNLLQMIKQAKATNAKVLLLATRLPPNYGDRYIKQYREVFLQLSKAQRVLLVPMLLEGVAGRPELLLKDRLHPNAKAQPIIFANVWKKLKLLIN